MSQLLSVLIPVPGRCEHGMEFERLPPSIEASVERLFQKPVPANHAWARPVLQKDQDFEAYFDRYFQTVEGRDLMGRSFVDIVRATCEFADALVLSYGMPDADILIVDTVPRLLDRIAEQYLAQPVELNVGWARPY